MFNGIMSPFQKCVQQKCILEHKLVNLLKKSVNEHIDQACIYTANSSSLQNFVKHLLFRQATTTADTLYMHKPTQT